MIRNWLICALLLCFTQVGLAQTNQPSDGNNANVTTIDDSKANWMWGLNWGNESPDKAFDFLGIPDSIDNLMSLAAPLDDREASRDYRPPYMRQMLGWLNSSITLLGLIALVWTIVSTSINTAQEGQLLGRQASTLWVPLRTMIGVGLLAPTPGGFSLIQLTAILVVMQSIHAANMVWGVVAKHITGDLGSSTVANVKWTQVAPGSAVSNTIRNLFTAKVCQALYNSDPTPYPFNGAMITLNGALNNASTHGGVFSLGDQNNCLQSCSTDPAGTHGCYCVERFTNLINPITGEQRPYFDAIMYGVNGTTSPDFLLVCGSFGAPAPPTFDNGIVEDQWRPTYLRAIQRAEQLLAPAVQEVLNSNNPADWSTESLIADSSGNQISIEGILANAQREMDRIIRSAPRQDVLDESQRELQQQAIRNGWLYAGSYFYSIISSAGKSPVYDPPTFFNPTYFPVSKTLNPGWVAAWQKTDAYINATASGTPNNLDFKVNTAGTGNKFASIVSGKFTGAVSGLVQSLADRMTYGVNPLVSIRKMGAEIILSVEVIFVSVVIIALAIGSAISAFSAEQPLAWGFQAIIGVFSSLFTVVLTFLWGAGVMMAVYVPMIPYIVWLFAALSWFILVFEAVVAAPLVALGFSADVSHSTLGKLQPSIMLLTGLFLRPTLMVIGFMVATKLSYTAVLFLNYAFFPTLSSFNANFMVFGWIVVMVVYVGIVISVLHISFSTIYVLPDKIMRWIGGRIEQSDIDSKLQKAREDVDKGAKVSAGLMKGSVKKAASAAKSAMKKQNKKAKMAKKSGSVGAGKGSKGKAAAAKAGPKGMAAAKAMEEADRRRKEEEEKEQEQEDNDDLDDDENSEDSQK